MNSLIQSINELSSLSPILPDLVKLSLIVIISILAFVPVSFLFWILSASFSKGLNSLNNQLERITSFFFMQAKRNIVRVKKLYVNFYDQYTSIINFDQPSFRISSHPAQQAIDNFASSLNTVPSLLAESEKQKSELVGKLNQNLENLASGSMSMKNMDIPELELDKSVAVSKRNAAWQIFIFAPFALAAMIVNSFLLDLFFTELFYDLDFELPFGLQPAIIVALLFTLIEAGTGFVFGIMDEETLDGKKRSASHGIMKTFGWLIIISLTLIEFILYLQLALQPEDNEDLQYMLFETPFESFMSGGLLAFLGPAIVFALYLFGHKLSSEIYKYSKSSDLERFKKDLDNRFKRFEKMKGNLDEAALKVDEIVKSIRTENVALGKSKNEPLKILKTFSDGLTVQFNKIKEAVLKAEEIEIPAPEIQTEKLSKADAEGFYRQNLVYLVILAASILGLQIVLPKFVSFDGSTISFLGLDLILALVFSGLAVIAGSLQISKVNVFTLSEGSIARVVQEKRSTLSLAALILIASIVFISEFFLLGALFTQESLLKFLVCLTCFIVGYFSGKKIYTAISSWFLAIKSLVLYIKGLLLSILGTVFKILQLLFGIILPILDALAFPARFLSKKIS